MGTYRSLRFSLINLVTEKNLSTPRAMHDGEQQTNKTKEKEVCQIVDVLKPKSTRSWCSRWIVWVKEVSLLFSLLTKGKFSGSCGLACNS